MIVDKGKFIITIVLLVGLLALIGFGDAADKPQAWALLGGVIGYVFANGKQLVSPFVPTPMIAPSPAKAVDLARQIVADDDDLHTGEVEAVNLP